MSEHRGVPMNGMEQSSQRAKRNARRRRREEREWRERNGPVTTRFVDPATLKQNDDGPPK